MRKILPILLLIPVLTVCFSGFFCADVWTDTEREISEESGLEDLKKNLPEGAGDLADVTESVTQLAPVLRTVEQAVLSALSGVSGLLYPILALAILLFVLNRLVPSRGRTGIQAAVGYASVSAVAAICGGSVFSSAGALAEKTESIGSFASSAASVMASAVAAAGYPTSASGAYAVFCSEVQVFSYAVSALVLPCAGIHLALGVAAGVTGNRTLQRVSGTIQNVAIGLLVFVSCLFAGVLSLRIASSGASDTVFRRAAQLSVSSYIPYVGPTVSAGLDTVYACARSVCRNAGVLAAGSLFLSVSAPLAELAVRLLVFRAGELLFDLSGNETVRSFFAVSLSAVRIVFAAAVAYAFLLFSSLGMLMGIGT